jgi:hypothetical protein
MAGAFSVWFGQFLKKFEGHKPIANYRRIVGITENKDKQKKK